MRISLIGMSNIGKSTWARQVAAKGGYGLVACDALIEKRLGAELTQKGMRGMASWMGLPWEPQYKKNAAIYLDHERAVMREQLARLKADEGLQVVMDTTGSVIYTGDDILAEMRATTTVVYLEASEEHTEALFKHYMTHPKPTIWGDIYAPQANESGEETLKRCYPELLRFRAGRYAEIAHMTIPFAQHRDRSANLGAAIRERVRGL